MNTSCIQHRSLRHVRTLATPFAAVSLLSSNCAAQTQIRLRLDADGVYRGVNSETAPTSPPREVYDCFRDRFWNPPGQHQIQGIIRSAGAEVGDNVTLFNYDGGVISVMRWNLSNLSTSNSLFSIITTFRWYTPDGSSLISSGVFNLVFEGIPISPNSGALIEYGDLETLLDMRAAPSTLFSIQYSSPVGVPIDDIGMFYGRGINRGSSPDGIRNLTTGQDINLGPGNNLSFGFDARPIPAPAAGALLFSLTLTAARRRRR